MSLVTELSCSVGPEAFSTRTPPTVQRMSEATTGGLAEVRQLAVTSSPSAVESEESSTLIDGFAEKKESGRSSVIDENRFVVRTTRKPQDLNYSYLVFF
jgi:hypothetical protein